MGRHLSGQISVKAIYPWICKAILDVDLEVLIHKGKSIKPEEQIPMALSKGLPGEFFPKKIDFSKVREEELFDALF